MIKFSFTVGFLLVCLLGASCTKIVEPKVPEIIQSEPKLTLSTDSRNLAFTNLLEDSVIIAFGRSPDNLFISEDNGMNWEKNATIPSNYHIENVARTSHDKDLILLTYDESNDNYDNLQNTGLLLSRDNGKSWEKLTHPHNPDELSERFRWFANVAFDVDDTNILYALSSTSVFYKSTDQGKTWSYVDLKLESASLVSMFLDPSNSNIIHITAAGTVGKGGGFVTYDKGLTWIAWGKIDPPERILGINKDGVLYGRRFFQSLANEQVIYSDDLNDSWEVLYVDESPYWLTSLDTFEPSVIVLLMTSTNTYEHTIRYSINYGVSWTDFKLPFRYPQSLEVLTFDSEKLEILVSSKNAIWRVPIYYGP